MLDIHKRFSDKYLVCQETGCWLWTANKFRDGYGQIKFEGRPVRAHRLAYYLYVDEIPEGMQVLHTCDTPLCVNHGHLFLGTHQDNMRDKVKKDRQAKGEKNGGGNKLTEFEIKRIKKRLFYGIPQRAIAKEFGVSQPMISLINRGEKWKHVST